MNRIEWTGEMDAALRDGLRAKFGMVYVAEDIGVAEGTARRRARELGIAPARRLPVLPRKSGRPVRELLFADLLAEGLSASEAGDRLGYACGNAVLQRIRSKLGPQAV